MDDQKIIDALNGTITKVSNEMIEFLKDMIRIPTENPPGKNYQKFSNFFSFYLRKLGYNTKIIKVPRKRLKELVHFGEGDRPIIYGIYGNGPIHIAFNGHYDVVPAGDGWTYNPYEPVIKDGFLYGRGSSDMKSGLAMQVFAIEILKICCAEILNNFTIVQTAVPDEETVGNKNAGTYYLVEKKFLSKENTDLVVITEPQGLDKIYYGHRGALLLTVKVKGSKSHGSMPYLGKNAIDKTCEVINELNLFTLNKSKNLISKYSITPENSKRPTISINTLKCGTWSNTVADTCEFTIFRRLIPEEKLNEVRNEINEILINKIERNGLGLEITENYATESVIENTDNIFYKIYSEAIQKIVGKTPIYVLSPGTFDLRFTHSEGIPTLNYGPGILEEAHMTDEKLNLDDFKKATLVTAYSLYKLSKYYDEGKFSK
ncbi:MAG: M20 family metallopeptidase [Thermoplasmata archaeon]